MSANLFIGVSATVSLLLIALNENKRFTKPPIDHDQRSRVADVRKYPNI